MARKNYAVEAPDIGRNACIPSLNSPVVWENTALFSLLDALFYNSIMMTQGH